MSLLRTPCAWSSSLSHAPRSRRSSPRCTIFPTRLAGWYFQLLFLLLQSVCCALAETATVVVAVQGAPMPLFDTAAAVAGQDPYHVFFLCGTFNSSHAREDVAWCHASSPDLVTQWSHLGNPVPPSATLGAGTVFPVPLNMTALPAGTGHALLAGGGGLLAACSAKDISLQEWDVLASSVLPPPPPSANCTGVGDVYVLLRPSSSLVDPEMTGTTWGGVVAATVNSEGVLLLFESSDLKNW